MQLRIMARLAGGGYELSAEPLDDGGGAVGRDEVAPARIEWLEADDGGEAREVAADDPRLFDDGWGIRMSGEARTVTAQLVADESEEGQ